VYHLVSNFYLETQIDQLEELFGEPHAEPALPSGTRP